MEGHTATCQKLLKLGADIAAINEAGSTALMLAVCPYICVRMCIYDTQVSYVGEQYTHMHTACIHRAMTRSSESE